MTREQWKEFEPYFTPKECGMGMDYGFMKDVLMLRLILVSPIVVHAGYEIDGHAPDSYHKKGRALDFHCQNVSPRRIQHAIDALGIFHGSGFYFWWNNPGFHIDNRPIELYQRWCSPRPQKYIYLVREIPV
jgi:hypothetical protein